MRAEADFVFEAIDYEGTTVMLSRATWQVKAGDSEMGSHPEIRGYLDDVKAAIASPDLVFQSTREERSRIFYRLRAGQGNFAGKHLVIVKKYVERAESRRGYVSTIYLSRAVYSQGPLLWPRTATASQ